MTKLRKMLSVALVVSLIMTAGIPVSAAEAIEGEDVLREAIDMAFQSPEITTVYNMSGEDITADFFEKNSENYANRNYEAVKEYYNQNIGSFQFDNSREIEIEMIGAATLYAVAGGPYKAVDVDYLSVCKLYNMDNHSNEFIARYRLRGYYTYDLNTFKILPTSITGPAFTVEYVETPSGSTVSRLVTTYANYTLASNQYSITYNVRFYYIFEDYYNSMLVSQIFTEEANISYVSEPPSE